MTDADLSGTDRGGEFDEGRRAERARFAEYLEHYEKSSRVKADEATTDESRVYQTTIANAMQAMRQAIVGGYHWKDTWRQS